MLNNQLLQALEEFTLSTYMGTPKPMGISKKEYQEVQNIRNEEDFKFDVNQRIRSLQFAIDVLNKALEKSIAKQGSLEVSCES